MSQFKVGPAKFRDDSDYRLTRDCHLAEIAEDGKLIIWWLSDPEDHNSIETSWRNSKGYAICDDTPDPNDVLPNAEPEWMAGSFIVKRADGAAISPVINARVDMVNGTIEILQSDHPIQIISGDVVDARENGYEAG